MPPGSRCLTQPPPSKQKQDPEMTDLVSSLSGNPGLLASQHTAPPHPAPTPESPVAGLRSVASPLVGPPSLCSLSIHLELPMAWLNIAPAMMTVPTAVAHSSPRLGPSQFPAAAESNPTPRPSEPGQRSTSQVLETPDHAGRGWTYLGPPHRTKAEKNRAKMSARDSVWWL